jgi:phosphate transport system substrate-binding protein
MASRPTDTAGIDPSKYVLVTPLGSGGMADVFLTVARGHAGFHKLIVVKRLRADFAANREYRALLLDEARLAGRLRHANVVQTFEVGEYAGHDFIAMEYLDGQPVSAIVAKTSAANDPIPPPLALTMVSELLSGLQYAHDFVDYDGRALGIVHRDVSPQNVFVTYGGEVKLVDFGLAKARLQRAETEVGILKGKLAYMAPEQITRGNVDRRVDVFAAGIVLWELLTGRRLFAADQPAATLRNVTHAPIAAPSSFGRGDSRLDGIVMKALARDPAARFQSATEMRDAIDEMIERSEWRRPRAEERGAWLSGLFATERREVEARVRACMETLASSPPPEASVPSVPPPPEGSGSAPRSVQPGEPPPSTSVSGITPGVPSPRKRSRALVAVCALALFVALGGSAVGLWYRAHASGTADAARAAAGARAAGSPSAGAAELTAPVLRIHGSNTIGAELMPALVEAFYRQRGATTLARVPGAHAHQTLVLATSPANDRPETIEVSAAGTATGFEALAHGGCDIAMASRVVSDDEAAAIVRAGLGDARTPGSEHVLALDGIAILVHPNNPLASVEASALASIFAGETRDWSKLGRAPGPIAVYARDGASGTYDSFEHLVLGGRALASGATRFADSTQLSDAVARDEAGIGFVGLAAVHTAKVLAVGEQGATPMLPSPFTVTTESYFLSRRLFLYTPARPSDTALAFVTFALSSAGQKIVRERGFVDLDVHVTAKESCDARCPPHYVKLVQKARRLSVDFRFGTGGLETRGTRDLERLVAFVREHPGGLMLLGFGDSGRDSVRTSRADAKLVASELAKRGVPVPLVEGFGGAMPVASNATDVGRARNRRVEVWLKD